MRDPDFFSRLVGLRDDIRAALEQSDGSNLEQDECTRERLRELEQLIAQWVNPCP